MKVAAVAIVKDEALYLSEWVIYHLGLGIDHFFIYDNFSTDNTQEVLEPYIQGGVLTLIKWPLFRGQDDAYAHAFKTQVSSFDWVTCFDVDEFYLLKNHKSIKEFLSEYADFEQVIIPWRFFGHSNHIQRPEGLVIENFTTCDESIHTHTKFFIKPESVKDAGVHVSTTKNKRTVNEHKKIIDEGRFHSNHTTDIIQLNHYFTRSYEEYEKKIKRGQADGRDLKKLDSFKHYDFANQDLSLLQYIDTIKNQIKFIQDVTENLPVNSGFLSDLFLPFDNLPIKYVYRDKIDELAKINKNKITKHLKYNFGSILQCTDDFREELAISLRGLISNFSVSPWHKSSEPYSIDPPINGCPTLLGVIEVKDRESIVFQVTGKDWLDQKMTRAVSFDVPSEGVWMFALSIGRVFVSSPVISIIISPEKETNSVVSINYDSTLIW